MMALAPGHSTGSMGLLNWAAPRSLLALNDIDGLEKFQSCCVRQWVEQAFMPAIIALEKLALATEGNPVRVHHPCNRFSQAFVSYLRDTTLGHLLELLYSGKRCAYFALIRGYLF